MVGGGKIPTLPGVNLTKLFQGKYEFLDLYNRDFLFSLSPFLLGSFMGSYI